MVAAPLLSSTSSNTIEGEYIVVFKREVSSEEGMLQQLINDYNVSSLLRLSIAGHA